MKNYLGQTRLVPTMDVIIAYLTPCNDSLNSVEYILRLLRKHSMPVSSSFSMVKKIVPLQNKRLGNHNECSTQYTRNIMGKLIIYLYYPALMLFLVYTFAVCLLRDMFQNPSVELALYIILWLFLTIQTTFAYIRIKNVPHKQYPIYALLSDCTDIVIAIYVCAAIGGIGHGSNHIMNSYLQLSIPFLILSVNQFCWFVIVRNFDIPAMFRICILFVGMFVVTVFEWIDHSFWNLVLIVFLIVNLGVLRAINKAPESFERTTTNIWARVKNMETVRRILFDKSKGQQ